jgi:hypothetical protein
MFTETKAMPELPVQEARMDPVAKRRWVEALRSGRYRQGLGSFEIPPGAGDLFGHATEPSYCALGVLALVHDIPRYRDNSWLTSNWHGIERFFYGNKDRALVEVYTLNDINRRSFAEIADYVEQNF